MAGAADARPEELGLRPVLLAPAQCERARLEPEARLPHNYGTGASCLISLIINLADHDFANASPASSLSDILCDQGFFGLTSILPLTINMATSG